MNWDSVIWGIQHFARYVGDAQMKSIHFMLKWQDKCNGQKGLNYAFYKSDGAEF